LVTLRRIAFVVALIVFMLAAAVFAYSNPQPITVDVGFVRLEQVSLASALAVVFACGWLFGLLSAGLALWRSAGEKRRLRRDLRYTEAELNSVRALPADDADLPVDRAH
jgi:uncharacterized membrane protein YciS (DUF1049 family)